MTGKADMSNRCYDIFLTELGWVGALASSRGLVRLAVKSTPQEALDELGPEAVTARHDPGVLDGIRHSFQAYSRGVECSLEEIPVDLDGAPPFFKAAWEACRTIPPGETRSYAWLAAAAGRPHAFRAAGQAMARNPLSIVVPCHRVIGSDGGLHGYGGGLERKTLLLELERRS